MGNGISVKTDLDLSECSVVFLVTPMDRIDNLAIRAMEKLMDMGIKHVKTITIEKASYQFAKTQQRHKGDIPAEQKFLKLTPKGNLVQLFF